MPHKNFNRHNLCTFPMQHEAVILNSTTVEEEFNITVSHTEAADIQRLCRIVTHYYFVEVFDRCVEVFDNDNV